MNIQTNEQERREYPVGRRHNWGYTPVDEVTLIRMLRTTRNMTREERDHIEKKLHAVRQRNARKSTVVSAD